MTMSRQHARTREEGVRFAKTGFGLGTPSAPVSLAEGHVVRVKITRDVDGFLLATSPDFSELCIAHENEDGLNETVGQALQFLGRQRFGEKQAALRLHGPAKSAYQFWALVPARKYT